MSKARATIYGWLLLGPAFVLLAAFTHWPAIATLYHSFHSTARRNRPSVYVGVDNYQGMIDDPVFWQALINNFWYAVGTIPVSVALAMLMALWVNEKLAGRTWLRLAYFTPTVLPMIAVANIWLFFYTPDYGLFDQIRGLFGLRATNWLGEPGTVLGCLIVMTIWKEAGFFMIFYLAALQSMPPNLAEAAAIEGCGRWTFFRRVTFPLLMPTTLFVLINAIIGAFRMVDHVVALTAGGPNNASMLLLVMIYDVAFRYWDVAYAATLTVVLLAILGTVALIQFVVLEKRIHYR
ncbi:MAG: sugar ABC transporter permease [Alphaproteobacteria bacterium]|nr:sugar ABC transporter permease [Alphaproteobacteria bacterium]MBN9495792.1 sugar ABC transporter permease [Alphaproteobacteria bacterium]MCA0449094.1 sugar ABC transporter permease [Pseudomonadota bacterium]